MTTAVTVASVAPICQWTRRIGKQEDCLEEELGEELEEEKLEEEELGVPRQQGLILHFHPRSWGPRSPAPA